MNAPTQDILLQNRKVLNWFGIADLSSPIHTGNPELDLVANVIKDFEKTKNIQENISPDQTNPENNAGFNR